MKGIYKFIAGNSRATPIGLALAALVAFALRDHLGSWSGVIYLAILLATLGVSVFEAVQ